MSRIVVSYRRSDSAATAGRIYDRLIDRYGEASVFMDIDKIPFGIDFRHHIQDVMRTTHVLLAVVGPRWSGITLDGKVRIADAADPVRVEIEAALAHGIAIIPLLVDGAAMPGAADLPESIRDFAYINAAPVDSGRDFRAHMERVIRSLDDIVAPRPGLRSEALSSAQPSKSAAKRRRSRIAATISIPIALLILAAIGFAFVPEGWFGSAPPRQPAVPVAKSPTNEPGAAPKAGPPTSPAAAPPQAPPAKPSYRVLANVSGGVQNLRSGPALKYPIVVAIPAGATGIALGACRAAEDNSKPWCAAQWRGHSGFMSSCCIVEEKTGAPPKLD